MSPDAYAAAARAEATRHFVYSPQTPSPQDLGEHIAVWARTYLEAQEPTDAEVEAAAQVWQAHSRLAHPIEALEPSCEECGYAFGWPGISAAEEGKRYREHVARAALAAARNARQEKR